MKSPNEKYVEYLTNHIESVKRAYRILVSNNVVTPDLVTMKNIDKHDQSKWQEPEWIAYLNKFYVPERHSEEAFKHAWLHHQHCNPHHPQYWCLQEDDKPGELEVLDMPECYIIEMICDWWSFSLSKGKPDEIHDWYAKRGSKYLMSDKTRTRVEEILEAIKHIKV